MPVLWLQWKCTPVLLYVLTFNSLLYYFCWCTVVDLVCMELTACQICVKRSLSPWSAMWSVLTCHAFAMHTVCQMSSDVCFVHSSWVHTFLFVRPPQKSFFCLLSWIWDEIVINKWRQIWNQSANFSLPPLLNLKLFPTTLLNAFTLLGQAMVS